MIKGLAANLQQQINLVDLRNKGASLNASAASAASACLHEQMDTT